MRCLQIKTVVRMFCAFATLGLGTIGCVSVATKTPYGVQEGHLSYVPARIATLNCQIWPAGSRFQSLPLSNVDEQQQAALCTQFDAYVLKSFSDQPYMKGRPSLSCSSSRKPVSLSSQTNSQPFGRIVAVIATPVRQCRHFIMRRSPVASSG